MKMSRSGQKTRSDESFNKERNMSYRLTKKRKYEDSSDSDADHTEAQSAAPKETKEKWKVIHEELQNIKDELKKKDEELKKTKDELASFKNRVAADVSLSIKTGKTESLNSPISKTRMVEMYQKFKLLRWPKIKDQLKSCKKMNPKKTEALIQKTFREAAEEMEMKKEAIREVFDLLEPNSGLTSQKAGITHDHRTRYDIIKDQRQASLNEWRRQRSKAGFTRVTVVMVTMSKIKGRHHHGYYCHGNHVKDQGRNAEMLACTCLILGCYGHAQVCTSKLKP
ncbi:uncharacterized protein KZ484_015746 isoform 1-T1 [Pholidichthys leucotaenia]